MPLSDFVGPEITNSYLIDIPTDQLIDLLMHKTNGLLAASRLKLVNDPTVKNIEREVRTIQSEIQKRASLQK